MLSKFSLKSCGCRNNYKRDFHAAASQLRTDFDYVFLLGAGFPRSLARPTSCTAFSIKTIKNQHLRIQSLQEIREQLELLRYAYVY